MKKKQTTSMSLPANACARCEWWKNRKYNPWGRCSVFAEKVWFKAPPCCEYEKDPTRPDEIELYLIES